MITDKDAQRIGQIMDERFDRFEEKVDNKLGVLEQKFDEKLDSSLGEMEQRLTTHLQQELAKSEKRIIKGVGDFVHDTFVTS